jgi:beta-lactamase class D
MRPITFLPCYIALILSLFTPHASAADKADPPVIIELKSLFKGYKAGFLLNDLATGETVCLYPETCMKRFSPCSTFKIPNSLIALDTGVVADTNTVWKWDRIKRWNIDWNRDQTMRSAFAVSCVPYYQDIAAQVGPVRMKEYVTKFHYGNEDISGGLTTFWLGSTLKISPNEQVDFLRKLVRNELPVSQRSMDLVKEIMIVTKQGKTVLRGKTGTGVDDHNNYNLGWFVGYLTRGDKTYVFATVLYDTPGAGGKVAKELTIEALKKLYLLNNPKPSQQPKGGKVF